MLRGSDLHPHPADGGLVGVANHGPIGPAQVHRARLKSGEEAAVKIQYPGIARTIREDFRNFLLVLLPGRLGKDWENSKSQFDDLRMRLERETDYEAEAAVLAKVRPLFRDEDGIVVPRVYSQYSTARVLTMPKSFTRVVSRLSLARYSPETSSTFRIESRRCLRL